MKYLFSVVTIVGSSIGAVLLFISFTMDTYPGQGAYAAAAVGFAVIPYCITRAVELLTGEREYLLRSIVSEIRKGASESQPLSSPPQQRSQLQRTVVSPNIGNSKPETITRPEKGMTSRRHLENTGKFVRTKVCPSCSEANRQDARVCFSCASVLPNSTAAEHAS